MCFLLQDGPNKFMKANGGTSNSLCGSIMAGQRETRNNGTNSLVEVIFMIEMEVIVGCKYKLLFDAHIVTGLWIVGIQLLW